MSNPAIIRRVVRERVKKCQNHFLDTFRYFVAQGKKHQKLSKSIFWRFLTFFAQDKNRQKCSKIFFDAIRQSSRGTNFRPLFQARKTQTQTSWSGYPLVGWGVKNVKGWGPKSSVCPSKPGKPNFLGRMPGILPGYPRVARKVWKNKSLCSILIPYNFLSIKEIWNQWPRCQWNFRITVHSCDNTYSGLFLEVMKKTTLTVTLSIVTCSLCHLFLVKEFPRFDLLISANLG